MGDDRPLRYIDPDGTVVYRASGLGTCDGVVLGLARGRAPAQKPEWFQRVLDEGTESEDAILAMYSDLSERPVGGSQDELVLEIGEFYDNRVIVRGHTDGLLVGTDNVLVQEAKKFRDSTWPKFLSSGVECMSHYPWQTSVYWHAAAELFPDKTVSLDFIGGHLERDGDDDPGTITEVQFHHHLDPPVPLIAIKKRIARWERMINEGLDLSDLKEPCSPAQFPCPMFNKGCPSQDNEPEPTELDGDLLVAALAIGEELAKQRAITKTAKQMADGAKKKIKDLEDGLRAIHEELGDEPKKMIAGPYTFTHINHPVEARMTKGYDVNYFKVTEKKDTNS